MRIPASTGGFRALHVGRMVCAAGVVLTAAVLGAAARTPSPAAPAAAPAAALPPATPAAPTPAPDPAAGVTNALAAGNAASARQGFAAAGLLGVAARRRDPAPAVMALWQECDAVLATAPAALRDAGVVHAATALAGSGDRAAALAMLAQHSSPRLREALARQWQTPQPAAAGRGENRAVGSRGSP